jgi:hypothetical protein
MILFKRDSDCLLRAGLLLDIKSSRFWSSTVRLGRALRPRNGYKVNSCILFTSLVLRAKIRTGNSE